MAQTKSRGKKPAEPAKTAVNHTPHKARLWLMYPPRLIGTPVIWQLAKKFAVTTNIRQASVTNASVPATTVPPSAMPPASRDLVDCLQCMGPGASPWRQTSNIRLDGIKPVAREEAENGSKSGIQI